MQLLNCLKRNFSLISSHFIFQDGGEKPSEGQKQVEKKEQPPLSPQEIQERAINRERLKYRESVTKIQEIKKEEWETSERLHNMFRDDSFNTDDWAPEKKKEKEELVLKSRLLDEQEKELLRELNKEYPLGLVLDAPDYSYHLEIDESGRVRIMGNKRKELKDMEPKIINGKTVYVPRQGFHSTITAEEYNIIISPNGVIEGVTWDAEREILIYHALGNGPFVVEELPMPKDTYQFLKLYGRKFFHKLY